MVAADRLRILVVEESPTLLALMQAVLAEAGHTVSTPAGRAPAAALTAERPDLVFLAGWETADEFFATQRADTQLDRVPVVAIGLPEIAADARPRPPEIVDVLPKPFSPDALLALVEHARARRVDNDSPEIVTDLGSLALVPTDAEEVGHSPAATSGDEPALAGDLGIIALPDVLALLDAESQTGALHLRHGEVRLRVYFSAGRIDLATADGVPEEFLLGRFLVRAGALAAPTLANALAERNVPPAPSDPPTEGGAPTALTAPARPPLLGAFLVNRGYIGRPALRRVLALQTAALVFESLRWGGGRFAFRATAKPPETVQEASLGLSVPTLLLEGFRRVDEWRVIEPEVGDFDAIYVRDENRVTAFGRVRLTREETAVLDLCDGRRTVRDIIDQSHLGAFDTTKMLYRLARTHLIRPRVAPVAMPA